jgi:hypothetical protein
LIAESRVERVAFYSRSRFGAFKRTESLVLSVERQANVLRLAMTAFQVL